MRHFKCQGYVASGNCLLFLLPKLSLPAVPFVASASRGFAVPSTPFRTSHRVIGNHDSLCTNYCRSSECAILSCVYLPEDTKSILLYHLSRNMNFTTTPPYRLGVLYHMMNRDQWDERSGQPRTYFQSCGRPAGTPGRHSTSGRGSAGKSVEMTRTPRLPKNPHAGLFLRWHEPLH